MGTARLAGSSPSENAGEAAAGCRRNRHRPRRTCGDRNTRNARADRMSSRKPLQLVLEITAGVERLRAPLVGPYEGAEERERHVTRDVVDGQVPGARSL